MVTISMKGDFKKLDSFFERAKEVIHFGELDKYGREGVAALKAATPKDTGKTANSWDYNIRHNKNSVVIEWTNSNINEGYNVAILLQYGHATGSGFYVRGNDYINPAMKAVFDDIAERAWKEVTRL